jgi:DNA-binding MarR family transcriptional regulator
MDALDRSPESLGVLIKETQSLLNQRMDDRLRPLALSVPQYALTACRTRQVSRAPARPTRVSRQSMNVLLQGLEKRGLVTRSSDPGPRRERSVVLNDAAELLLERAHEEVSSVVQRMTMEVELVERARLYELLARCRDALLIP